MLRNTCQVVLASLLICFAATLCRNTLVSASEPSSLKMHVVPPKVLADNNVYNAVIVQLQDSKGVPARAGLDISIHLSSSLTHIGNVDPVITIPKGATYATAKFYSTFTPGTTSITATATGYTTVQASITTAGPVPSKLVLYSLPPALPSDNGSYRSIIVQLQDNNGSPAKAPIGDVNVTLSSSSATVGLTDPYIIIRAGDTYSKAAFNTTNIAGTTIVTAIASGYTSGSATVKTQETSTESANLKVYAGPAKVPADGIVYETIAVQLQDSQGKIARAQNNITVNLASSDIAVGSVDQTIIIDQGDTYTLANFYSTYRSGITVVTAVATDHASAQASVTAVGPVPSKLAVYCAPSSLPSDSESHDAVLVQLQGSGGTPAKDPVGDVVVELFSSKPEVGNVSSRIAIPFGKAYSVAVFNSTYTAGSTIITVITPGYSSAQATVTTYLIEPHSLSVEATANPSNVSSNEQATIRIYVAYEGVISAPGVIVNLTSNVGGNFSSVTDERNGYYTSVFTTPTVSSQTTCAIMINVSRAGYTAGHTVLQVTVSPAVGNLRVHVTDTKGQPIPEANVTSISQPSGVSPLGGLTNEEGYVDFNDILAGAYTVQASKTGYETRSGNIVVSNQTALTVDLPAVVSALPDPVVVGIILAAAVVTLLSITLFMRKKKSKTAETSDGAVLKATSSTSAS